MSLGARSEAVKRLYLGLSFGQIDDRWSFCLGQVEERAKAIEKVGHVRNPLKDYQKLSSDCTSGGIRCKSKVYWVFV